jgi:hypothetical protein
LGATFTLSLRIFLILLKEKSPMSVKDDLELKIIADCLRRVRNGMLAFTTICLAFAMIFAGVGLYQKKDNNANDVSSAVIGLGGASIGAGMISLILFVRYANIKAIPIYKILQNPQKKSFGYIKQTSSIKLMELRHQQNTL